MKKLGTGLVIALALCVGLMGTALANGKNKKKTITLDQDVMIQDQLIKRGTYKVSFDASDNLVTIMKDNTRVATAKVNVKVTEAKAQYNSLGFTTTDKGKLLTTITFEGDNRTLHINNSDGSTDSGELR